MIPILYEAGEASFATNGLGGLSDVISCKVTEERNGIYELEMEYPNSGVHSYQLVIGNIIRCTAFDGSGLQAFRIYRTTYSIEGTTKVYAQHISYDLNYMMVKPFASSGVQFSMNEMKNNISDPAEFKDRFDYWTNVPDTVTSFRTYYPMSVRSILGGDEGSLLDVFRHGIYLGGLEYEWDNFTVKLWTSRGADDGIIVRYSKDLNKFENDADDTDFYNQCVGYWVTPDDGSDTYIPQMVYGDIQTIDGLEIAYPKMLMLDVSDYFETQPTKEQINEYTKAYLSALPASPASNFKVEFTDPTTFKNFNDIAPLKHVKLCDIITIITKIYAGAGYYYTQQKTKVIKTVWDAVNDKYESIELGDKQDYLYDLIVRNVKSDKS